MLVNPEIAVADPPLIYLKTSPLHWPEIPTENCAEESLVWGSLWFPPAPWTTAVGVNALNAITTGDNNTAIGADAGQSVTTGDNNTFLGHDSGRSASPSGNVTTGSNIICLGDNSVSDLYCADTSISSSDARDKTDVTDFTYGLAWIKELRPVTYRWDRRTWYGTDEEPAIKEIDVCKSIFGFDKTKVGVEQGNKFFVECNFSVLKKLAQKMLFNVKVMQTLDTEEQTNDLEESTEEIVKSEYSKEKAQQMLQSIKSQLTYLDENNSLDEILQVENHIRGLDKYGHKLELISEPLRKQSNNKIQKDIYGSWVVDNATSVVLEGNTIQAIENNFNKKFRVA